MSTHHGHNQVWLFGVCLNDFVAKLLCLLPARQWSESFLVIILIPCLYCRLRKADPSGANDEACGEVDLDVCIWKNHCSGVPAIADDPALALLGVLAELGIHELANVWMLTDLRDTGMHFRCLELFFAHFSAKQVASTPIRQGDHICSQAREPICEVVARRHAISEHCDGDDAVYAARIEGDVFKGFGEQARSGGFATAGRTVDGDNHSFCHGVQLSSRRGAFAILLYDTASESSKHNFHTVIFDNSLFYCPTML